MASLRDISRLRPHKIYRERRLSSPTERRVATTPGGFNFVEISG
jgi:hypothetical protein